MSEVLDTLVPNRNFVEELADPNRWISIGVLLGAYGVIAGGIRLGNSGHKNLGVAVMLTGAALSGAVFGHFDTKVIQNLNEES